MNEVVKDDSLFDQSGGAASGLDQVAACQARGHVKRQVEIDAGRHCRKAAGVDKGSGTPNTDKVGKVNRAQLEEIATTKMPDLTAADMDAAVRTVAGTARSMGIEVEGVK